MIGKTIEQTRISLEALGIPEDRALAKATGTTVGYLAAIPGLVLCFAAVGTLIFILVSRPALTTILVMLAIAGVILLPGILLTALGFSLIARDAAPWIAKAGEWLVNAVMRWRGK